MKCVIGASPSPRISRAAQPPLTVQSWLAVRHLRRGWRYRPINGHRYRIASKRAASIVTLAALCDMPAARARHHHQRSPRYDRNSAPAKNICKPQTTHFSAAKSRSEICTLLCCAGRWKSKHRREREASASCASRCAIQASKSPTTRPKSSTVKSSRHPPIIVMTSASTASAKVIGQISTKISHVFLAYHRENGNSGARMHRQSEKEIRQRAAKRRVMSPADIRRRRRAITAASRNNQLFSPSAASTLQKSVNSNADVNRGDDARFRTKAARKKQSTAGE